MTDQKDIPQYAPSAKEQSDIDYAMRFRKQSYEDTRQERQEWRSSYLRYKLSRYLSEYEYVPDVQLGLTYDTVERITASLPGREFGFRAKPVGEEDTTNALLVSDAFGQAWRSPEIMDGPTKMDVVKKNMALFGTCFTQVYWETVLNEMGEVVKSDPCFIPLNIFDVYYNKFIPTIEELPEIGYQSIVSLAWLRDNGKQMGFKNVKYVRGFTPRSTGHDEDSSTIDKEETPSSKTAEPVLAKLFEVQSDKEIMTFALDDSGPVWLRKVPNKLGRKNIVIWRLKVNPLPNRLLGITDVSRAGGIEDAIQRQMNLSVFNSLLVNNPNFSYDATDRNIDPRTFVTAPGAGIPRGRNADALTPITFDSHTAETLQMVSVLMERYKKVVNTPDILSGEAQGNTATSDNLNDINAKASVDRIVDGMKGSMQKLAVLIRELYKLYGPESLTVQMRTPELIDKLGGTSGEISLDDLVLERDIEIVADFTTQNKSILSRRIVEWLNITSQDQSVPPQLRMSAYRQWLEFNDLNDLAAQFEEAAKVGQTSDLSLADQENQKIAAGTALPPTPNASTAHTQRHIDFMRRADTGPEIDRILQAHIEGELQAAQGAGGMTPEDTTEDMGGMMPETSSNPMSELSTIGTP